MRRLILVTLCAVVTFLCSAQNNRVVNGVVFTVDGTPMSGAVLRPIGTQLSCTTNADGTFRIQVPYYVKMVEAYAEGFLPMQVEIDGSYMVFKLKVDKKYLNAKTKAAEAAREAELQKEKEAAAERAKAEEAARIAEQEKAKAAELARLAAAKEAEAKAKAEEQARKEALEKEKADSLAKARAAEQARLAAEKEAAAKAKAEEQARIAAEKEAAAKAKAEEQARLAAEKEAAAKAKAEEQARLAAMKKAKADSLAKAKADAKAEALLANSENYRPEPQRVRVVSATRGIVKSFEVNYSYPIIVGNNQIVYENLGVRNYSTLHPVEFNYSIGYRFNDWFSVGVGAGLTYDLVDLRNYGDAFIPDYVDNRVKAIKNYSSLSIPLFVNAKFYMSTGKVQPMISISGGLYVPVPFVYMQNMWLFDAGVGCNFKMGKKSGVYVLLSIATVPALNSSIEEEADKVEFKAERASVLAPRIKIGFNL